ncbi:putative ribonuclease H-like domain-containing protein [Tanacetum coccineum]
MVDYPFTIRDHDDSEIPTPKDMMTILLDVFFYNASYNDEGAVADFTNLETIVNRRNNHKDFQHCLFACFLSQNEPKKILEALEDENLPYGKKAIGTKWVYRNKKDERGVVVRNKARLVAQGHRQEEGIDYDEVFAPVARIEAIRIFLAFASYMGFIVYQMDVKSAFLYGKIDEEILDDSMGELTFFLGLQVKQKEDGIFISQDKYVAEILKKFDFVSVKTASTPIETQKPLVKDEEASDVDVHLYRSMIGSLMYLTASRPDIMFVKCAFLEVSSFDLEAYSDSDYAGTNLDRKSTTGGAKIYTEDKVTDLLTKDLMQQSYLGFRESLERDIDGTEELLLPDLFILWLTKVSTDSAKLIPLGKDSTAIKTLEKIPPSMVVLESCPKHNCRYMEKTDGNTEFHEIISLPTRISNLLYSTESFKSSTTFVEQFWMSAKSKLINNVRENIFQGCNALFDSMLVQPTEDEGDTLERQSEPQPIPSPPHLSEDQHETQTDPSPRPSPTTHILDSIPEGSGGNHGDQAKEIKHLKAQIKKLKKKAKPVITHHSTWKRLLGIQISIAKAEPTVHKDPVFDELDDDTMDYMETEDAQDVGRTTYVVHEEKESAEKGASTKDPLSTTQPKVSTHKPKDSIDKPDKGTDKPKVSTDKEEVSTDRPDKGTVDQNEGRSATQIAPTITTPTIVGDDETIAQVLIIMSQNKEKLKEKEKGVELKDVEETERPRPTSTRSLLTLKPLPKIDQKDKGKKMIEEEDESDTDSEDITEAERKFKQLARDEEVARKVQEDWEAEEEVKKLAEEEATKAALSNEYDFIQARLNVDKILAEKLQEEEREMYTIEKRAKFLHDTIAAQRRFLAQQRSEAIRNKPPSRNHLRNQMMTYLKHVGGKKHSDLKTKGFEEIKALYDKIKRFDDSFIAIGFAEDEKKDDSIKGEIKEEEGTRKRKLGTRKKMKSKKRKFTFKDDKELRLCLTIVSDEDKEVDYEILDKKYPIIEWRSEYLTTKPQYDETEEIEDVYLNVVIRSNRQRRYFSTLMAVLSILDRDDICAIYQLVMNRYQDETPEGFDKILWGDLIIMFNQSGNDEFWNAQQNWKINKYPLKKEVLSQLLKLKLETEEDSTMALELIRFVKKQIAELEPEDSDGDEKDL